MCVIPGGLKFKSVDLFDGIIVPQWHILPRKIDLKEYLYWHDFDDVIKMR